MSELDNDQEIISQKKAVNLLTVLLGDAKTDLLSNPNDYYKADYAQAYQFFCDADSNEEVSISDQDLNILRQKNDLYPTNHYIEWDQFRSAFLKSGVQISSLIRFILYEQDLRLQLVALDVLGFYEADSIPIKDKYILYDESYNLYIQKWLTQTTESILNKEIEYREGDDESFNFHTYRRRIKRLFDKTDADDLVRFEDGYLADYGGISYKLGREIIKEKLDYTNFNKLREFEQKVFNMFSIGEKRFKSPMKIADELDVAKSVVYFALRDALEVLSPDYEPKEIYETARNDQRLIKIESRLEQTIRTYGHFSPEELIELGLTEMQIMAIQLVTKKQPNGHYVSISERCNQAGLNDKNIHKILKRALARVDLQGVYYSPDNKILDESKSNRIKLLIASQEEGDTSLFKCLQDREIALVRLYTQLNGTKFINDEENIGENPLVYDRSIMTRKSVQNLAKDILDILELPQEDRPWIGSDGRRLVSENYQVIIKFKTTPEYQAILDLFYKNILTETEKGIYTKILQLENGRYRSIQDIAQLTKKKDGSIYSPNDVSGQMQNIAKKINNFIQTGLVNP